MKFVRFTQSSKTGSKGSANCFPHCISSLCNPGILKVAEKGDACKCDLQLCETGDAALSW